MIPSEQLKKQVSAALADDVLSKISRLDPNTEEGAKRANLLKFTTERAQEILTRSLVDAMEADKWPDTDPRSTLEDLVKDLSFDLAQDMFDGGTIDIDEAVVIVDEFMDAHVLAGRGEDEIVDNAADRLSDSHAYSRDAASYFGHGNDDF